MTATEIEKLMDESLPFNELAESFSVFRGLEVLKKYVPNADIDGADRAIVYTSVSANDLAEAGITEEDLLILRQNNWMIEDGYFAKYV